VWSASNALPARADESSHQGRWLLRTGTTRRGARATKYLSALSLVCHRLPPVAGRLIPGHPRGPPAESEWDRGLADPLGLTVRAFLTIAEIDWAQGGYSPTGSVGDDTRAPGPEAGARRRLNACAAGPSWRRNQSAPYLGMILRISIPSASAMQ
jgi:hypothetical protein